MSCCVYPPDRQSPQESFREFTLSLSIVILFIIGVLIVVIGLATINLNDSRHLSALVTHPLTFGAIGLAVLLWWHGSRAATDLNEPVPEESILDLQRFAVAYGMKAWCQHELDKIQTPNWLEFKDLYARMAKMLMAESRYVLGYSDERPAHDLSETSMRPPVRPQLSGGPRSAAKAAVILFGIAFCITFMLWVLQFLSPYEQDTTYMNLHFAGILALISGFFVRAMMTSSNDVPLQDLEALNVAQYARQLGLSNQLRELAGSPVYYSNVKNVLDLMERQVFNPASAKVPV